MSMICPVCKSDMIVVEFHNIELDYCTDCHGVWFDSGELEFVLESIATDSKHLLLDNILHSPEAISTEKKRKCPICGRKMKKTTIGQQPEILIDACCKEDGLWFDGGELAHLIGQLSDKSTEADISQQNIISFLKEVFRAQ